MNDFSRHDLDTLKAQVDLAALMRQAGIDLQPAGQNLTALCPWHDDKTPSLVLNPKKQLYNCFGCKAKGDVLDFLQQQESLSFSAAVSRLRELKAQRYRFGPGSFPVPERGAAPVGDPDRFAGGLTRPQLLARVAEHYKRRLSESAEAQEYLKSRGLGDVNLWEAFGLGYCDGSLLRTVPKSGDTRQALIDLGILSDKGKEHFLGCVVVPLEHPDLGIVGMYGRRMNPKAKVRHLFLPGPKRGVLNWQVLQTASSVLLVEGVFDALSLWVAGVRNVSSLYGTSGLPVDLNRHLRASTVRELQLCLDADRAGDEGLERITSESSDRFRVSKILLPAGADPNDLLVREGPEILRSFTNCVQPLTEDAGDSGEAGRDIPLCDTHERGFTLAFEDAIYEVEPRPPYDARLSVAIKGARADGAGRKFRDRCDLMAVRSRSATLRAMSQTLSLTKERAEVHLMEILETTEAWVQSVSESEGDDKTAVPVLSDAQKVEALQFLQSPDLVDLILRALPRLRGRSVGASRSWNRGNVRPPNEPQGQS